MNHNNDNDVSHNSLSLQDNEEDPLYNQVEGVEDVDPVIRQQRVKEVMKKMSYLTFMAAIGGFLFGYDTGTMNCSFNCSFSFVVFSHACGCVWVCVCERCTCVPSVSILIDPSANRSPKDCCGSKVHEILT